MESLNLSVVFIEGLLSFFSPCILPILPIYLSILSNSSVENLREEKFLKGSLFINTIFFTLGISITFFILGSSINALGSFFRLNKDLISIIGGFIIILMGLFYMEVIEIPLLNREKRFHLEYKQINPITAFLLGFTFSFGWTPCIGPMLASVLIMASSVDNILKSYLLIGMYTIGFIVPFILIALFYNKLIGAIDNIKPHMDKIKKIGGIVLIISGLLMSISALNIKISSIKNTQLQNSQNEYDKVENNKIKALDFSLYDQYGKMHSLSDYEGKIVFLNIWATWCPPCKEEMPYIEDLYKEYNENKEDIVILGLASPNLGGEGSVEHIEKFLNEMNYTFPVVFDEGGALVYQYGISAFPTTFIIDRKGYIKHYIPGAMDKETMKFLLESINKE